MSRVCQQREDLDDWTFPQFEEPGLSDRGSTTALNDDQEGLFAVHKTLKRKHPKRRNNRNDQKLTKTDIVKLWSEASVVYEGRPSQSLRGSDRDGVGELSKPVCGDCQTSKIDAGWSEGDDEEDDFSWIYSDLKEGGNLGYDIAGDICSEDGLSQTDSGVAHWSEEPDDYDIEVYESERLAIEEEIKRKYKAMEKVFEKIISKQVRRSKRLRKARSEVSGELEPINIEPIRRRRRTAQPIRNALLVRSSIKKAWKGTLGSCCGKGCWAKWKWANLKRVMSDYE